jgi:uncharacterized protein YaeQ
VSVFTFEVTLSDLDRNVFVDDLKLSVAQHPSETIEFLVTRVLAYLLEYQEGIAFSPGLSSADEPAVSVRDLTGRLVAWVEVGSPDWERLHRASKAADRVAVYCHRDVTSFLRRLEGKRIHRADELMIRAVDRPFLDALIANVDRRTRLELSVTDGELFAQVGGQSLQGTVVDHKIGAR